MPTDDEILNLYTGGNIPRPKDYKSLTDDDILNLYAGKKIENKAVEDKSPSLLTRVKRGVMDVLDTGARGIGAVDELVSSGGKARNEAFKTRAKAEEAAYDATVDKDSIDWGRMGGQALATAPLVPAKAVQAINIGARALPTVLATGQKVAAPLVNRIGAAIGTGALGGAVYGGATAGVDKPIAPSVGEGLITGALAGPVATLAGATAGKLVNMTKTAWDNLNIGKLATANGIEPNAAKNVIERLGDAGYTPQSAQAELDKLGPKATIMDLDRSLQTEGSGLASVGGKPTSILKNRMDVRAESANNNARDIMTTLLGPKPNLEAEKEAIINDAQKATKVDYETAHVSPQKLDVSDVSKDIDTALETAVGRKASVLKEVKGYLYDQNGNLKDNVKSLHEVRQGIDDIIKNRSDALPPSANRAINGVRDAVDTKLKTVKEMKAADEKYAERMSVKDALEYGANFDKERDIDNFKRTFDAASTEGKEAIRKGQLAAIHNKMDLAQRGEYAGAQQELGKKSANRQMLKYAFGAKADHVLNALQNEAAQRGTEKAVTSGSQTAERQAVQARYGARPSSEGMIAGALKGAAIDTIFNPGSLGAGTAIGVLKTGGKNTLLKLSENRLNRLTEGTADLLSKQGSERTNALSVLDRVSSIQSKGAKARSERQMKLPVTLSGVLGTSAYEEYNKK